MQIYGPSQLHGAQSINGPHTTTRTSGSQATGYSAAAADDLQLSDAGQLASQLSEIPDIRQDRVSALRAAIQSGTYETPERLSGAINGLLDEIG
jgi:flagellar biosynthesis anti-sigma factor FlgM